MQTIEQKDKLIESLLALLTIYLNKSYEITGLLGADTSFSVRIEGPFGKKELIYLSNRLRADAEHLKDGTINKIEAAQLFKNLQAFSSEVITDNNHPCSL